jgi:hypothetical protein
VIVLHTRAGTLEKVEEALLVFSNLETEEKDRGKRGTRDPIYRDPVEKRVREK